MSESYSCVTVCLQGPKLHLFQACRFREEKKSQEKTRDSYYSKLPAKDSDRQPAGGDKTALEIPLKDCKHLSPSVLGSWQRDVSL